ALAREADVTIAVGESPPGGPNATVLDTADRVVYVDGNESDEALLASVRESELDGDGRPETADDEDRRSNTA
ncbi:hypothetical protein ACFQDD_05000, partial [Halorubrum pallidum]